jgi:hypothetical protein
MMKIVKMILCVLLGVFLGVTGHKLWLSFLNSGTLVEGVLKMEPKSDPALYALYPSGFYVESRVYLETASENMLGRNVGAHGDLDITTDPDTRSYPKIKNKSLIPQTIRK